MDDAQQVISGALPAGKQPVDAGWRRDSGIKGTHATVNRIEVAHRRRHC
jgi:hypothetical protein